MICVTCIGKGDAFSTTSVSCVSWPGTAGGKATSEMGNVESAAGSGPDEKAAPDTNAAARDAAEAAAGGVSAENARASA